MKRFALSAAVFVALASPAPAHVGHGADFTVSAGFAHPFSGLDHLAAMIAVGLWSAIGGGRRVWVWPLAFVAAMIAAAVAAQSGIALPFIEPAIAATVLVLGLLVAASVNASVTVGAAAVASFAVAHGYAHGMEAPPGDFAGYVAGFAAATAALHAFGIGIGVAMPRFAGAVPIRILGGATAALGLVQLVR